MKGKNETKKGIISKLLIITASIVLTAIISVTATLAWFFDRDWASKDVTMAGAVGITLRDNTVVNAETGELRVTSGAGNLHFNITTDYVYPGQSIDVHIQAYNNSGTIDPTTNAAYTRSQHKGSPCYVRASFRVYTDIGMVDRPGENEANAQAIYNFLFGLIDEINHDHSGASHKYRWVYFRHYGNQALSSNYYFEGTGNASSSYNATEYDRGYFYLCYDLDSDNTTYHPLNTSSANITITNRDALYPLKVDEGAAFLWDGQFVMPWQLTNYSADKHMYVIVEFQAIQTFIPQVTSGVISSAVNNQVAPNDCTFYNPSVQTVFNSSAFDTTDISATLTSIFGGTTNEYLVEYKMPPDTYTSGYSYAVYPGGEGSAHSTNTVRSYNADGTVRP